MARCLDAVVCPPPLPPPGILFIPDRIPPDGFPLSRLQGFQEKAHAALLNLTKALHPRAEAFSPSLFVLSQNTQSFGAETPNPVHATLWGMGRTIAMEYPAWRCRLIDGSTWDDPEIDLLIRILHSGTAEDQLLVRASQAYAARLNPLPRSLLDTCRTKALLSPEDQTPYGLCLESAGSFQNLTFKAHTIPMPASGEIQIRVEAAGLNFLDVLTTLGTIPPGLLRENPTDAWILGQECAGIVTAVGDGVESFHPGQRVAAVPDQGAFSSTVLAPADLAVPIPDAIGFSDAATIPIAFLTAYYSLRYAARLSAGERVLIHAGTGGVGMAAIQTAKILGAEIYATAGSEEKRRYLKDVLGVAHVADSRSLGFAEEIREMTQGEGVDVVLNALAGEFIEKNLSILRPFGRFIEIGKRDVLENRKLGLRPFLNNLTFTLVDLLGMTRLYPKQARRLFQEVMDLIAQGRLTPLPKRIFPIARAKEAFRFMAQAGHIGKIVLSFEEPPGEVAPVLKPCVRTDGAYLITGGAGFLGLELARWLVDRGAGCVVLANRREPSAAAQTKISALENGPTAILPVAADVSKPEDVAKIMARIRETRLPLRGVIHAAGVLRDGLLINQTEAQYAEVMAPKVAGAWNLHRATEDLPLDFFVLFSSATSILGTPGQSNYAAANAFLDGLAEYRAGQQKPALSINWGAWAGGGMMNEKVERMLEREGSRKIAVPEGLKLFEQLLTLDRLRRIVVLPLRFSDIRSADVIKTHDRLFTNALKHGSDAAGDSPDAFLRDLKNAPEAVRADLIRARVLREVEAVYGLSESVIDSTRSFEALGFDSLMLMELKNQLEKILGTVVPNHLFHESRTIDDFIGRVADKLAAVKRRHPGGSPAGAAPGTPAEPSAEPPGEAPVNPYDLALESLREIPQVLLSVDRQQGRRLRIGRKDVYDFASLNYLGMDLEPEVIESILPAAREWGLHPSWTRLIASPALFAEAETALAQMMEGPSVLLFPSVTLLHMGVLPALTREDGVILADVHAHFSIRQACSLAAAEGVDIVTFRHNDMVDLADKLSRHSSRRSRVIAVDGVYSMAGDHPPLAELVKLAGRFDALVYVDDAHGVGVIGEHPTASMPYGFKGNGIVRHYGLDYVRDNILYVGGLSKAFSSYAAFVVCHSEAMKAQLATNAFTYSFSGPSPVASIASVISGIRINREKGDRLRAHLYRLTRQLVDGARKLGFEVENTGYFPIAGVMIGETPQMTEACRILWDHGILITPAMYPAVPVNRSLLRFSVTAANTEQEVGHALRALEEIRKRLFPGEKSC